MEQFLVINNKQQLSRRCLPDFLSMFFRCQIYRISKNQFVSAKLFLIYIYISLTYKYKKCELFECFANAISLRLNKILFASFKNFILLVASHILCVNYDKLTISIKTCVKTPQKRNKSLHIFRSRTYARGGVSPLS